MFAKLIRHLRVKASSRRLALRDKGDVEDYVQSGLVRFNVHPPCCTRLRVGIDVAGNSFIYCYRCEQILANCSGEKETPLQRRYKEAAASRPTLQITGPQTGNVVELAGHKKATSPIIS